MIQNLEYETYETITNALLHTYGGLVQQNLQISVPVCNSEFATASLSNAQKKDRLNCKKINRVLRGWAMVELVVVAGLNC
jgi:hypothetical protein